VPWGAIGRDAVGRGVVGATLMSKAPRVRHRDLDVVEAPEAHHRRRRGHPRRHPRRRRRRRGRVLAAQGRFQPDAGVGMEERGVEPAPGPGFGRRGAPQPGWPRRRAPASDMCALHLTPQTTHQLSLQRESIVPADRDTTTGWKPTLNFNQRVSLIY